MKIAFLILFVLLTLKLVAQDCSISLLFKKGAELEYKTYAPGNKGFSSKPKFFEITRLTFIVEDVKDSNNMTYSYITKKGVAANNEKDRYEKKYLISCKNGEIFIPFDFYSPDTVYLSDVYPKLKNKGFYTATNNKEMVFYKFPSDPGKNKFTITTGKFTSDIVMRDFGWEERDAKGRIAAKPLNDGPAHYEQSAAISETKYSMSITCHDPDMQGKEKITTSAGAFDCYKLMVTYKSSFTFPKPKGPGPNLNGRTIESSSIFYYNPEVGFVKTGNSDSGYFELIRIKR